MKRVSLATGIGALLAAATTPLAAQEGVIPLDSAVVAGMATISARIDGAAGLRFKTPWGTSLVENPRLVPSGLGYRSLTNPGSHLRAPAFEIQARGRATVAGMQVGAAVLGLAGAILGTQFAGLACLDSQGCRPPAFEGAVAVGLLGAAAGALIGGVVGSQFTTWRTIYRYPDAAP